MAAPAAFGGEEFFGRQIDQQPALVEKDDAIGNLPGKLDLVRDEEDSIVVPSCAKRLGKDRLAPRLVISRVKRAWSLHPAADSAAALASARQMPTRWR